MNQSASKASMKIAFIGGGNMANALIGGWLKAAYLQRIYMQLMSIAMYVRASKRNGISAPAP